MKILFMKLTVFCIFTGLAAGFFPTTAQSQQESDQAPLLLIKIPDIEKFLSTLGSLTSSQQGPNTVNAAAMIRMILQGTDWIDPGRCIVAGMAPQGAGPNSPNFVILIPFIKANDGFKNVNGASAGSNYYLMPFPPRSGFSVSPVIEKSLADASRVPASGSLVMEIKARRLMSMVEPQIIEALRKAEAVQPPPAENPQALPPTETISLITGVLDLYKQVDILRTGMDLAEDNFLLNVDAETLPGSALSGVFTDPGGTSRLMNFPIDLPIRYHSRARNVSAMQDLMESIAGPAYRQIGIDFKKISEISKNFTGETAGGLKIDSDGFIIEQISVLKPGIDGKSFVRDTYLPLMEQFNTAIAGLTSGRNKNQPQALLYQRTKDSQVEGTQVTGIRINLSALSGLNKSGAGLFEKDIEMRIAIVKDMMFTASNDARLADLMKRSRNLSNSTASGPMGRIDMDLAACFKGIQPLLPPGKEPIPWPGSPVNLSMQIDMKNGKLATRIRFNVKEMGKLIDAFRALLPAPKPAPAKEVARGNNSI